MLPASALRPFLFAKIHGMYSGFRTPEELLSILQSGSLERALQGLPLDAPVAATQLLQEFQLHRAFLELVDTLLPVRGPAGRFFQALLGEYEARNVSIYLKTGNLPPDDHFALPYRRYPLTRLLLHAPPAVGRKLLEMTPWAAAVRDHADDPPALDLALEETHYRTLHALALRLPAKDRIPLLPLLRLHLDLRTTVKALRLHKSYARTPAAAVAGLFFHDPVEEPRLAAALPAADPLQAFPPACRKGVRGILAAQHFSGDDEPQEQHSLHCLERAAALYLHRTFVKGFYRAHRSLAPLFCFYFLLKREILNTALLTNCIRFEVPPDTFRQELIS